MSFAVAISAYIYRATHCGDAMIEQMDAAILGVPPAALRQELSD